jgi:hypothetical protein
MIAQQAEGEETPIMVMRAYGVATRTVTGEGDNGPWTAFIGQFKAVNLLDGVEYTSGKMFLPGVASDLLEGELGSAENNSVEFGFDIIAVPDESSATGYVYQAESLIEPEKDDTFSRLEQAIPAPALYDKSDGKTDSKPAADKPAANRKPPAKK